MCKRGAGFARYWRARGRYSDCGLEGFSTTLVSHPAPASATYACQTTNATMTPAQARDPPAGVSADEEEALQGAALVAGEAGSQPTRPRRGIVPRAAQRSQHIEASLPQTPPRLGAARHIILAARPGRVFVAGACELHHLSVVCLPRCLDPAPCMA